MFEIRYFLFTLSVVQLLYVSSLAAVAILQFICMDAYNFLCILPHCNYWHKGVSACYP